MILKKVNNKVFWATGIHPFNSPLPFAQNGNFSLEQNDKRDLKIRKARCTLTSLSLRSARLTQYIWLAPAVARPIFASAIATANIRYTETLDEINFCTLKEKNTPNYYQYEKS